MKASTAIVLLLASFIYVCPKATAQTASGLVNAYYQVSSINTTANSITVDNAAGLTPGMRVLLIQSKGAAINASNAAAFGDISSINDAGNYEFNTICTITGNEVGLKATLLNAYDPAGMVQLISIPSYGSVVISGTVNSASWDPVTGKGGIVVMEATDTIFLNADIDVSGQGFPGGSLVNYPTPSYDCSWTVPVTAYYLPLPASGDYTGGMKGAGITDYILNQQYGRGKLANGGGGGNNTNTGGGGGGNYGAGGIGGMRAGESAFKCHGPYPGIGGLSLASYGYSPGVNRIFFGGGGGSGHENNGVGLPGGNGGGIIILSAKVIVGGGGQLLASGIIPLNPTNTDPTQAQGDGGGGGGAGGTIILNATTVTGSLTAKAAGAKGSDASNGVGDCTGPGGGGGGGVIWTAGSTFPVTVVPLVSGGMNGVVSVGNTLTSCRGLANGALPGNAGAGKTGYSAPESTLNTCVVLASSPLKYFTGNPEGPNYRLSWSLYTEEDAKTIHSFTLQRSVDQTHFNTLAIIATSVDSLTYQETDTAIISGTVFYRLVWLNDNGLPSYSRILSRFRPLDPALEWVRLQPNPAGEQLSVKLFSTGEETGFLRLYTAQGQLLASYPASLHIGATSLILPLKDLPAATYFLVVETKDRHQVKGFIRK